MFALCLAYCLPSGAQVGFQSYDPVGDSIVVAKMRAKMGQIPNLQHMSYPSLSSAYQYTVYIIAPIPDFCKQNRPSLPRFPAKRVRRARRRADRR